MKMYLKKLMLTVLFLAALVVLYAVLAVLLTRFLFWFKPSYEMLIYTSLILSTVIMLYIVYLKRWENKSIKAAYLEAHTADSYSFGRDFIATLKSRENIIHTLAFVTLDVLQTVLVGIAYGAKFLRLIIGTIRAVTPGAALFAILNTLVWCVAHKRWHRSRFGGQKAIDNPL